MKEGKRKTKTAEQKQAEIDRESRRAQPMKEVAVAVALAYGRTDDWITYAVMLILRDPLPLHDSLVHRFTCLFFHTLNLEPPRHL